MVEEKPIYYFVDGENVGHTNVASFLKRNKFATVFLFTGRSSFYEIPEGLRELIDSEQPKVRLHIIHSNVQRKEHVDKLLIAKLGEIRGKHPEIPSVVIGNDNGYALCFRDLGWNISVLGQLPSLEEEDCLYWKFVSKRSCSKRPQTIDALTDSIRSFYSYHKHKLKKDPILVIHCLINHKKISTKSTDVTWLV